MKKEECRQKVKIITGKTDKNVYYNALYPYQVQNTFNWNLIFLSLLCVSLCPIFPLLGWIVASQNVHLPRS